ncbi:MAG: methionine aminopeptidase, partial [Erysipelotrichales bacterium]|nr:methionine aminopeptidase [Erysipelotrichales bacterium]
MDRKELRSKLAQLQAEGKIVPPMSLIKTEEQLQGIRESAAINTALLDYITPFMKEGITTEEIDKLV